MASVPSGSRIPLGRTLYARAVLADTGALLALADNGDSHSVDAVTCIQSIARHNLPFFISIPTIYESHRRLLFDLGHSAATRFLESIYDGSINILRTIDEDEQEARRILARYQALNLTQTDAVNMALMIRFGIATVFSFDRAYPAAGFIRIPPFHL